MQQFDLIIVGGGLAGASLAVALRDARLRIALVESHPPVRPDGWDARIYAVSPANAEFLQGIGAWRHLDAQRIAPIAGMQVFGDNGGKLAFSAFETGVPELGWIAGSGSGCGRSNFSSGPPRNPPAISPAMRYAPAAPLVLDGAHAC